MPTGESSLLYMRSRYYSPDLRPFLSADRYMGDIYHPASLNPYSYVEGNPVRYIDPMGYWATEFATYKEKRPIPTIPKKLPLSKKKSVQRPPSLLSQSLYDVSVDCADGTDPFRQSVRYQIFSRQAEKLGLYGTDRKEYIRFLRTVYGSLEYGRADGLSGMSYTDAELMEMYGFDESSGRLSEKILYQQGYEMGRAERDSWGLVATIILIKDISSKNSEEKAANFSSNTADTELFDWDLIEPTQPVIESTNIPRSFVVRDLELNGNKVWVHGNTTKHIGEFVISAGKSGGGTLAENEMMLSFVNALKSSIDQPLLPGRNMLFIEGWEIGINSTTGVVYHALMK